MHDDVHFDRDELGALGINVNAILGPEIVLNDLCISEDGRLCLELQDDFGSSTAEVGELRASELVRVFLRVTRIGEDFRPDDFRLNGGSLDVPDSWSSEPECSDE